MNIILQQKNGIIMSFQMENNLIVFFPQIQRHGIDIKMVRLTQKIYILFFIHVVHVKLLRKFLKMKHSRTLHLLHQIKRYSILKIRMVHGKQVSKILNGKKEKIIINIQLEVFETLALGRHTKMAVHQ